MTYGRMLSIQSHVVHGYVGNRAAVFPLQLLGFEVDYVNSVQFSNHTQYRHFKGQRLNSNELGDLIDGLRLNSLLNYTHILTGYVGDVTFLNKLADLIEELKAKNPDLIYLCDPVLGDNGKLYVPEELINVYVKRVLPQANIITPNLFELEILYGSKIVDKESIYKALSHCHEVFGVQTVIVSSSRAFNQETSSTEKLVLYASSKQSDYVIEIEFDRLPGIFYGTGDAFAAMVFAWLTRLNNDLKSACEHAISAMLHILKRTNESRKDKNELIEMKLIQSKKDIEEPSIVVKGVEVPRKL